MRRAVRRLGNGTDCAELVLIFLYGTLRHAPLLAAVLGRDLTPTPARAPGWRVAAVEGEVFPVLVRDPGSVAEGILISETGDDRDRLDFYELGFGYVLDPITVETDSGPVEALVYHAAPGAWPPAGDWSLDGFAEGPGEMTVIAAASYMRLWPKVPADQAAAQYPNILHRAASRLRARRDQKPPGIRRADGAVETLDERRPYRHFFEVSESDLRFRRFDGGFSPSVNRAAWVMSDAVTVLPYDPVRDRALVIEQFRYSPIVRGDANPWSVEPIAGRIDAGEEPEDACHRECLEEAGLKLSRLLYVGRYYPSPGAVSEYLYSYIGIADLPDAAAGLGGLDVEHEDIRAHILKFDALLALVDEDQADNAPLILSILSLARMRDRLRAEAGVSGWA